MIHIQQISTISKPSSDILRTWQLDGQDFVVFDIETTGLAASHHRIYAISLLCFAADRDDGRLHYLQIEALEEEAELLRTAHGLLQPFDSRVSYNGSAFDLHFLDKRCRLLQLPLSFEPKHHIDVYRLLFPYRNTIFTKGMKQVQLEEQLLHRRSEFIGGGEVIEHFFIYLQTGSQEAFDHLFRHNTDDVCGLTLLLQYGHLFSLQDPEFWSEKMIIRQETNDRFTLSVDLPFVSPLTLETAVTFPSQSGLLAATVSLNHHRLRLDLPIRQESLKYFFNDYKNYDYLPEEDMAIHRSLSCFVEKQHRKRATKSNAYTKKENRFVPLACIPSSQLPVFYHAYQSEPPMMAVAELYNGEADIIAQLLAGYLRKVLLNE